MVMNANSYHIISLVSRYQLYISKYIL